LNAGANLQSTRNIKADFADYAVQPISAAILSVAERHSDPMLCIGGAGAHYGAQHALTNDDGAAYTEVTGSYDCIAATEVTCNGRFYIIELAHNFLRRLTACP